MLQLHIPTAQRVLVLYSWNKLPKRKATNDMDKDDNDDWMCYDLCSKHEFLECVDFVPMSLLWNLDAKQEDVIDGHHVYHQNRWTRSNHKVSANDVVPLFAAWDFAEHCQCASSLRRSVCVWCFVLYFVLKNQYWRQKHDTTINWNWNLPFTWHRLHYNLIFRIFLSIDCCWTRRERHRNGDGAVRQ